MSDETSNALRKGLCRDCRHGCAPTYRIDVCTSYERASSPPAAPASRCDHRTHNPTCLGCMQDALDGAERRVSRPTGELEETRRERDENEQAHLAEELRALRENQALAADAERLRAALREFAAEMERDAEVFKRCGAEMAEKGYYNTAFDGAFGSAQEHARRLRALAALPAKPEGGGA